MSSLVLYFSRAGENYFGGSYKVIEKGNTQIVAEILQRLTQADMFKIEPKIPLPENYKQCIDVASEQKNKGERPEVAKLMDSIDKYDTIYIGYPIYWGTMPMYVLTFLENYDFTGKTIYPFCTNEGSGLGSSITDIKNACKGATVNKGFAITGSEANKAESGLKKWLKLD